MVRGRRALLIPFISTTGRDLRTGSAWLFHLARVLLQLLAGLALAAPAIAQPAWVEAGDDGSPRVHLYFFWAENCPHCQAAHPFVAAIPHERPWVVLHQFEVSRDRANARRFVALAESVGQSAEAVPALIFCGRMEVGWRDEQTAGTQLLRALDACRAEGPASAPPSVAALQVPLLGSIDPTTLSLPLITVVIAALDAFNPCAFFVLLFLLSLLAQERDRRRMLAVGGIWAPSPASTAACAP